MAPKATKKAKDPNAPKRPLSAYFLYLNEHRPRFVAQGLKVTEIAKAASVEWKALSPQQKAKYEDLAAEAKAKYEGDKAKYEASKST